MTYALHSTRARCRAMPKVLSLSAGMLNAGTPPAGGTASAAGGAAASKADKERQRKERQKQRKVAEAEAALQAALAALDHNDDIR